MTLQLASKNMTLTITACLYKHALLSEITRIKHNPVKLFYGNDKQSLELPKNRREYISYVIVSANISK